MMSPPRPNSLTFTRASAPVPSSRWKWVYGLLVAVAAVALVKSGDSTPNGSGEYSTPIPSLSSDADSIDVAAMNATMAALIQRGAETDATIAEMAQTAITAMNAMNATVNAMIQREAAKDATIAAMNATITAMNATTTAVIQREAQTAQTAMNATMAAMNASLTEAHTAALQAASAVQAYDTQWWSPVLSTDTISNINIDSGMSDYLLMSAGTFDHIRNISGQFYISSNANLESIDGFGNLTSVGHLQIYNNANLQNFDGLRNLRCGSIRTCQNCPSWLTSLPAESRDCGGQSDRV